MRLQEALGLMSPADRLALRERRRIVIDPRKRIDEIEQMARALIAETDLRHSRLPADARALLERLASAGGRLANAASDPGAKLLCELGVTYAARGGGHGAVVTGKRFAAGTLVLPSAFLVQVPSGDGDDPRSLRVCLGLAEPEIVPPLVQTVVGKPLAVSGPLALQEVLEVLAAPGAIAERIGQLAASEARLLDAIERAGSEVTTDELLALDQTPGLIRTSSGIAVPKRGAPYMLQRRGLLFQLGVDRFVLPSEVSSIVGARRQSDRAVRRARLLTALDKEDHAPRRARYARDPSLAAAAALAMLRCWGIVVRDDTGVPRNAVKRVAERLGEREETTALLIAMARAAGLGRMIRSDVEAPGSLTGIAIKDVGALLRSHYRRGGAWDETRLEPEIARVGPMERSTSGAPVLRSIVLDALEELARDRWVPVDAVVRFAMDDPRAAGAARIHARAGREKHGAYHEGIEAPLRTMLTESLPAIGLADLGEDGAAIRFSVREGTGTTALARTTVERATMTVPSGTPLYRLLEVSDFAEPDHLVPESGAIAMVLGVQAVARARARSMAPETILSRLSAIGVREPLPAAARELADGLSLHREVAWLPLGGALVVQDQSVRDEVLADPTLRRMIVDVEAGDLLLVRDGADVTRLQARLARMGVRSTPFEPAEATGTTEGEGRAEVRARRSVPPRAVDEADEEVSNG